MSTPTKRAALLMVLRKAQPLAELHGWPPVGANIDALLDAAEGRGPFGSREAKRLTRWADRWAQVPPQVREFFARNAESPIVNGALWYLVAGMPRPAGARLGMVLQLYERQHGFPPPFDLLPRMG